MNVQLQCSTGKEETKCGDTDISPSRKCIVDSDRRQGITTVSQVRCNKSTAEGSSVGTETVWISRTNRVGSCLPAFDLYRYNSRETG